MNGSTGMLPKINTNEVTKTLKFGDRLYTVRPWKTKDERNFLIKQSLLPEKELTDNALQTLMIDELIKPCVIDGNFNDLSFAELKKIMITIRTMSMGDDIQGVKFKCSECGFGNIIDVYLDEEGVVDFKDADSSLQEISDELKIRFKPLSFRMISKKTDEIDLIYNSVQEIVYNGQSYSGFTKADFEEFFDNLDIKTTKTLMEKLEKSMDSLEISKDCNCAKCGAKNTIDFGDSPNFFMP
jgi:hypothetical protein